MRCIEHGQLLDEATAKLMAERGVVEEGALADLLLGDGDPLADLKVLADPQRRLLVVTKDGRIYRNLVR